MLATSTLNSGEVNFSVVHSWGFILKLLDTVPGLDFGGLGAVGDLPAVGRGLLSREEVEQEVAAVLKGVSLELAGPVDLDIIREFFLHKDSSSR